MFKDTDGTRTVPTRDNRNELRISVEAADRWLRSNSVAPRCGRIVEALLISYVDTRGIGSMYPFGEVPVPKGPGIMKVLKTLNPYPGMR